MKKYFKLLSFVGLLALSFFSIHYAFADSAPAQLDPTAFMTQVLTSVQSFGGLPWAGKIASILMLVIASMKVTFLDDLIWNKLGRAQLWLAPFLGLVTGVMFMKPFSWAGLFAYMGAGAGAVLLHEILDSAKGLPGLGPWWTSVISMIEGALGGNPVGAVKDASSAKS